MTQKSKAIVIGASIGGIATAARLAKNRYSVTVLEKGAAFGLSHNFWQVGYLRPQNRHKRYKNLYFSCASTHPGTGLPIVLLSARLTTQRILLEKGTIPVQNMVNAVAAATD